jgi:hypothetical protein
LIKKRYWILLACLIVLSLCTGCIEAVFGSPIRGYVSFQLEQATLPKFTDPSNENFLPAHNIFDPGVIKRLTWTNEDNARLKANHPEESSLEEFRDGFFSPSGNILITQLQNEAHIRDRKGNLVSKAVIRLDSPALKIYFRPDEKEMAIYEYGKTSIWMSDGFPVKKLEGWEAYGYSQDGRYLLANSEKNFALLDSQNKWTPKILRKYDEVRGISYSDDHRYLLTYGCVDGIWWESGFFCFRGEATLWDQEGNKVVDFSSQDEVNSADFTRDMKHVITQGCDRLWTPLRSLPFYQKCLGVSARYYDFQGKIEGIYP